MDQRCATAIRHLLASVASSTPPQLPSGYENSRNNKELPLGDKTPGTKEELQPLASAATLTSPQLLLGEETLKNKEELPLGYKTPGKKGELHPLESAVTSTPPQIP